MLWAYVTPLTTNGVLMGFSIGTHYEDAYGRLTPIAVPLSARDEVVKWTPATKK